MHYAEIIFNFIPDVLKFDIDVPAMNKFHWVQAETVWRARAREREREASFDLNARLSSSVIKDFITERHFPGTPE